MKNKLTNYLKLGILLFGISLFFINCEKDDSLIPEKNNSSNNNYKLKVSDLLFNDYSKNEKVTSQLYLLKEKQIFAKNNRAVYNSTYDFTVQTETVRHIENTETGYESFTFAVHRDNSDLVENLLISYKTDTDYFAYLIKYDFTATEYQNLPTDVTRSRDVLMTPLDISPSDYINDKITISIHGDIICVEEWETFDYCCGGGSYDVLMSVDCTWLNSGGGGNGGSGDFSGDGSIGDGSTTIGSGGGGGGGGSSSDPSDSDYDPTTDPSNPANHGGIATSPVIADEPDPHINNLTTLTNNPIIKQRIDELAPKIFSVPANNFKEDGARFNRVASNSYVMRPPSAIHPHKTSYSPAYQNNETVSVHIHQQLTYQMINGVIQFDVNGNPLYDSNSPLYSDTDITEFLDNIQYIKSIDPTLTNEVTSLLISQAGIFALVVDDKTKALATQNALLNNDTYEKFKDDFNEKVLKKSANCQDNCFKRRLKRFIKKVKVNGQKLGISIYFSILTPHQNNTVTINGWVKL